MLVVVSVDYRVRFATPVGRRVLRDYFGRPTRMGLLPPALSRWLQTQGREGRGFRSLIRKRGRTIVFARCLRPPPTDSIALLLEWSVAPAAGRKRYHYGLTSRQNEVLHWVAAAKTDREIAAILGIRECTVGAHLVAVYRILGVESRTAAASFCRGAP